MSPIDRPGQAGSHSDKDPSLEQIDDIRRDVQEMQKRWHDRLTLDNRRLPERYIHGKLDVVLTGRRVVDAKQFRAFFHKGTAHDPKLCPAAGVLPEESSGAEYSPSRDGGTVFVGNVDFTEGEKVHPLPSIIWLQVIDEDRPDDGWGALYFSVQGFFKLLPTPPDWEAAAVGCCVSGETNRGANKEVERATGIVGAVAYQGGELIGDGFGDDHLEDMIACIRPVLTRDTVRASLPECLNGKLKIEQMLFGPFDFKPWTPKRVGGVAHDEVH